jgi:predicted membrane chloride channel (bestrophin family)
LIVLTIVNDNGNNWGITGQGHSFAGMIVSFLVVSRINTALARYNECRNYIGAMYREASKSTFFVFVKSEISSALSSFSRGATQHRRIDPKRVGIFSEE